MKLLVYVGETRGLSAHIPNANGHPICKCVLKPSNWQIEERDPNETKICHNCEKVQAKITKQP